MTKRHFLRAAEIVLAIRQGEWTHEPPEWVEVFHTGRTDDYWCVDGLFNNYTRAAATAEAFIALFREFNPDFHTDRFLIACGLMEAPTKKGRA